MTSEVEFIQSERQRQYEAYMAQLRGEFIDDAGSLVMSIVTAGTLETGRYQSASTPNTLSSAESGTQRPEVVGALGGVGIAQIIQRESTVPPLGPRTVEGYAQSRYELAT